MIIIYELIVRAKIRKSESEAQAVAGCQPPQSFLDNSNTGRIRLVILEVGQPFPFPLFTSPFLSYPYAFPSTSS